MLPNQRLKFEAFPNKSAAEVTGFTREARIYER